MHSSVNSMKTRTLSLFATVSLAPRAVWLDTGYSEHEGIEDYFLGAIAFSLLLKALVMGFIA